MHSHGCSTYHHWIDTWPWMQLPQAMDAAGPVHGHGSTPGRAYMHEVVAARGQMKLTKGTGIGLGRRFEEAGMRIGRCDARTRTFQLSTPWEATTAWDSTAWHYCMGPWGLHCLGPLHGTP
eukprot:352470-Chlamydomonas_euryale.AAC.9